MMNNLLVIRHMTSYYNKHRILLISKIRNPIRKNNTHQMISFRLLMNYAKFLVNNQMKNKYYKNRTIEENKC